MKFLLTNAAASSRRGNVRKVMLIDIGKAHLYAPSEVGEVCETPLHVYGQRTAPSSWEKEYTKTMEEAGFVTGLATACAFFHKEKNIRVVVHGDDFTVEGAECDLRWVEAMLRKKYIVKMRAMLGPERTDDKVADILNRVVEWKDEELWYEADPRHVEKMLNDMELGECKESVVPGTKTNEQEDDNEQLDVEYAKRYRSVVARGNFLAQDRPDIRKSVKELYREMSSPSRGSWRRLKKLCRYLKGTPRVVQRVKIGVDLNNVVNVYVDSDWAGCTRTRRSTNGGCILLNGACLKTWSPTQTVVARSSGEAEYYAAVKGAAEGMAVQSMLADFGLKVTIEVHTDSSACRGICNRRGLGKLRHLNVALLWLQQRVQSGKIILRRIAGSVNPADLFTKHLARAEIIMHSGRLGFCTVSGRTTQVDTAHVELWRPECCSSTRPRGSVSRRDTIQVETHCRSSWKGSAHAPSDDPCSG